MRRRLLSITIVLCAGLHSFGQSFHLKDQATGRLYGPYEPKDGKTIVIHTNSYTVITGKIDRAEAEARAIASANSIQVLMPYRHIGTWVFDDPSTNLKQEPFVAGVPEIIDKLVKDIPEADKGFRLLFSDSPFPGHTHKMDWIKAEKNGNWYYCKELEMKGWLCSAPLRYFKFAPQNLYVKAEKK